MGQESALEHLLGSSLELVLLLQATVLARHLVAFRGLVLAVKLELVLARHLATYLGLALAEGLVVQDLVSSSCLRLPLMH